MDFRFLDDEQENSRGRGKMRKRMVAALVFLAAAAAVAGAVYSEVRGPASAQAASAPESRSSSGAAGTASQGSASSRAAGEQPSSDWRLVLVNGSHEFPENFQQQITDYYGVKLDSRLIPYYGAMKKAAAKDGVTLWISSAYRSRTEQKALFEKEVRANRAKGLSSAAAEQAAQKTVARPGYSEHNTGLALDLNGVKPDFDKTAAYAWLQEHAAAYGFILRFPKGKEAITQVSFEPWHYRFVGPENAEKIKASGMCLEEYLQQAR
jgi:D-alanyl-D-alanine carboxypeptidase